MKSASLNEIESFINIIPRTVVENLEFRKNLHEKLSKDVGMQNVFLDMCRERVDILFDTCLWTFDPRQPRRKRNLPFILRPQQQELVAILDHSINKSSELDKSYTIGIEKSRDEGATELITKLFAGRWLLDAESMFLVASRKAEYVDRGVEVQAGKLVGAHKCLMHKIVYGIVNLPEWMKPNFNKTHMLFQNRDNGSVITGEATTGTLATGDRQLAIFIDEHGAMDPAVAESILDCVHDVTRCNIVASTHYKGTSHPFCKFVRGEISKNVKVYRLEWWKNPVKNRGLYYSPDYDEITIKDIDFYKEQWPEIFKDIEKDTPFIFSKFKKQHEEVWPDEEGEWNFGFIADGGDCNSGGFRSPWYDLECLERSLKDVAQNLDIRPVGTGNAVFDPSVLHRIRQHFIRLPEHSGEIKVLYDEDRLVAGGQYQPSFGRRRFKWWSTIVNDRPDQSHNYIIACDISTGNGVSNSVAKIIDVNTYEEVGQWVCPNTPVESFAEQVVAICKWVGGHDNDPYLIWEANGIGGSFGPVIKRNDYHFYYIRRDETSRIKTNKNADGWWNNDETKDNLCNELNIALRAGVEENRSTKRLILYDEETVQELSSYLFLEGGHIGPSSIKEDPSGARKRHGDRVIASGLAVLALTYQRKAVVHNKREPEVGSFLWRIRYENDQKEDERFRTI